MPSGLIRSAMARLVFGQSINDYAPAAGNSIVLLGDARLESCRSSTTASPTEATRTAPTRSFASRRARAPGGHPIARCRVGGAAGSAPVFEHVVVHEYPMSLLAHQVDHVGRRDRAGRLGQHGPAQPATACREQVADRRCCRHRRHPATAIGLPVGAAPRRGRHRACLAARAALAAKRDRDDGAPVLCPVRLRAGIRIKVGSQPSCIWWRQR